MKHIININIDFHDHKYIVTIAQKRVNDFKEQNLSTAYRILFKITTDTIYLIDELYNNNGWVG